MDNIVTEGFPETVQLTFRIRDERKSWFEQEMGKLARRAAKLGVPAPTYAFGAPVDERVTRVEDSTEDNDGGLHSRTVHEVEEVVRTWPVVVSGAAPRFAGWELAGTIQLLSGEPGSTPQVIIRSIAGTPAPARYREAATATACDHCQAKRRRTETFLVVHDDGTWKQVGRQCIRDFLGHRSPENIARMAEFLLAAREIGEGGEWGGGGGRGGGRWPLDVYLGYVAAIIEKRGWVSKAKARELEKQSTATEAHNHMAPSRELLKLLANGKWERLKPTEAHAHRGAEALEWARELTEEECAASDYLHNLRVIAGLGVVEGSTLGYAASIIIARDKALDRVRERAERPASHHVGTVGERVTVTLKLERVIAIENEQWGTHYLHMFVDAVGNDLKWFGSTRLKSDRLVEEGAEIAVRATIKKHEVYKGREQTILTRVQAIAPPVEKPKKNKATKAIAAAIVAMFETLQSRDRIVF
jgi:hypothetical protein